MLLSKSDKKEQAQYQVALGLSFERLCRNIGRSLVAADYPGHDAEGIPRVQGISWIVRTDRDKYSGRSSSQSGRSWNYSIGERSRRRTKAYLSVDKKRDRPSSCVDRDGAMGRPTRRNAKSGVGTADAERQGKLYCRDSGAVGKKCAKIKRGSENASLFSILDWKILLGRFTPGVPTFHRC